MSRPKRGDVRTVEISAIDTRGWGMGVDGDVVFHVAGAVPGDVVSAEVVRVRRDGVRCHIAAIEVPSPDRVEPRCGHTDICGGCRFQHLAYPAQLRAKAALVRAELAGVPGFDPELVSDPLPSPELFFYRNKMEYSAGIGEDGRLVLGLHRWGRFDAVFDLAACHLQSEAANALVGRAREVFRADGWPPYHPRTHEGLVRYLVVREGKTTGQRMATVVLTERVPGVDTLAEALAEAAHLDGVILAENPRPGQTAAGVKQEVLAGEPVLEEKVGRLRLRISPGSFFQTNSRGAALLAQVVEKFARLEGGETVLDCYCGTGLFGLTLAERSARVIGVEMNPDATLDATHNAEQNGIHNCTFHAADARAFLNDLRTEGARIDAAVVDPPRAGMPPKAIRALCDLWPRTLVYVSCNVRALATDLTHLLGGGYRVEAIQPLDLFPHTPHVEVVVRLVHAATELPSVA